MDREHLEILREHGFRCSRCERQVPEVALYITGERGVETVICSVCMPSLIPSHLQTPDEREMHELLLKEEQLHALILYLKSNKTSERGDVEIVADYWNQMSNKKYSLSDTGKKQILVFLDKLSVDDIKEAINIAFSKRTEPENRFSYMCGILNNWVKDRSRSKEANEIIKYWNYKRPQEWKRADDGKVEYTAQQYDVVKIKYYIDNVVEELRGWASFDDVIAALKENKYG